MGCSDCLDGRELLLAVERSLLDRRDDGGASSSVADGSLLRWILSKDTVPSILIFCLLILGILVVGDASGITGVRHYPVFVLT